MSKAATQDVQRLYEFYPYPHSAANSEPDVLLSYVFRGQFLLNPLAGWRIPDAGCGTGYKLAGLAATYPHAQFLGIELSGASVTRARKLLQHNRISNADVRQANILE